MQSPYALTSELCRPAARAPPGLVVPARSAAADSQLPRGYGSSASRSPAVGSLSQPRDPLSGGSQEMPAARRPGHPGCSPDVARRRRGSVMDGASLMTTGDLDHRWDVDDLDARPPG